MSPARAHPRPALAAAALALLVGAPLAPAGCLVDRVGGAFRHAPEEMRAGLSREARLLLRDAFGGIEAARLRDFHVHVVGLGAGGTGAYVHPRLLDWAAPRQRLKFKVYASAAGITDLAQADAQYVERLVRLARAAGGGRFRLLAFDRHHRRDGSVDAEKTEFYTPNEYVFELAARHPDLFEPVMSVHPYRTDAIAALEHWAARGGRYMKWLPNAMGMDPGDEALAPFYDRMRELGVALLTHAGEEKAVEAEDDQALGNPLRLRLPLAHGVRVLVAHCASLGQNEDLDDPRRPLVDSFTLFLRLMDEPRWRGLLYGEISATTQSNRLWTPLETLFARKDLHARLVNGSDYPLPAINVVVRTSEFRRAGWLSQREARALNEIYDYNPLLFDFALKRTIRPPGGERLPASIFMARAVEEDSTSDASP